MAPHPPCRCHPLRIGGLSRAGAVGMALLLCLLTACGGGGGSGSGRDTDVLSEDEATAALLTETNLGDEYVVTEEVEDDSDSSLSCLDALGDMEDTGAVTVVDRTFEFDSDVGLPTIGSEVSSYEAVGDVNVAFAQFRSTVEECTSVAEQDADGTHTTLTVAIDNDRSTTGADDQVNLVATGFLSSDEMEFPVGVYFTAARVDNHVTSVDIVDLGSEVGASIDAYVKAAVDRLTAVAEGEKPENALVDLSAGGDENEGGSFGGGATGKEE